MKQRRLQRWVRPTLALTIGTGIAASSLLAISSSNPASAEGDDRLRVWTGAFDSSVGTGLAAESCDFTGDGKDDILTSDWLWERAPFGTLGAVYVIPNGTASGNLENPTTGITRIEGPQKDLSVGFRLNCAGDVNGDGFDDVLIDEGDSSRVWVVFGSAKPENISLEFLGDRGFAIDRPENIDGGVDTSTAGVGDLNGDGFDDIAIVSPKANDVAGQVTVIAGRNNIATAHTDDEADVLMRINGSVTPGITRVQSAGDIDGDGINDLIVGAPDAPTSTNPAKWTGSSWVVSGASRGDVDLAGDFQGFTIEGPSDRKNRFGMIAAPAGDVNNDGYADVLIGAPGSGTEGGAALVLGGTSQDTVYTDPTAANGEAVWSGEASDPTDRGWWIHDSASGSSNLLGFNVGADQSTDAHVGTLVIGVFIKNFTVAIPTTLLGDEPVIDLTQLDPDQKATFTQERSYLGRAISVVHGFDEGSCTQLALGGRGDDLDGAVNLYAVPWTADIACEKAEAPEAPGMEVPGMEVPGTEEPGTEAPDTETPSTDVPGTDAPSTEEPDLEEPGSEETGSEETDAEETGSENIVTEEGEETEAHASGDGQGVSGDQKAADDPGTDHDHAPAATATQASGQLSTTGATISGWIAGGIALLLAAGAAFTLQARKKKTR